MTDDYKTKAQLIDELATLHQRVLELEAVEETLQQRTAQMAATQEVALELVAQLDLGVLLHSIVSRAVELLGGSVSGLALYRPEHDALEAVTSAGDALMPIGTIFHRGEGLSGQIWETGEPLILDRYENRIEPTDASQEPPIVAALGVPICWGPADAGADFLGTLVVKVEPPRTFSAADVELLNVFASQAAIAIRNARLYEEVWRRSVEQETVSRLVQALNTFDLHDAFPVLTGGLRDLTGCDRVSIALPHEDGEHFVMSVLDTPSPALADGAVIPMSFSAAYDDLAAGRPHLTADLSTEINFPSERILYQAGLRSRVNLPLFIGREGIGSLNLGSCQPNQFREHQLPVLQQIADALARAIHSSHLFEAERRQRQQAETLREAVLVLTTALERDEVITRILAQLQQVVPYDSSSVQLLVTDPDDGQKDVPDNRLVIVGGHGFPNLPDLLGISFSIGGDNPNTEVIHTREPVIVGDAPAVYGDFHQEPHDQAGIRSWLGVPMLIGDRLIGMIALDKKDPDFYTHEHARMAEAFAAQAAIAVENARLFQAEREQRALAEALASAAAAVNSTLAPEEVLDRILDQVRRIANGDTFSIMLLSSDGTARMARWRGHERMGLTENQVIRTAIPITEYPEMERLVQTGDPLTIADTTTSHVRILPESWDWLRSYVSIPIRVADRTVGILNVGSTQPSQFAPADVRRLQALASHAATAIENARLHRQLEEYADQLEHRVQERTAQLVTQFARSEAILRSTTDGIVVTDANGEILQTNPVAHTWLTHSLSLRNAQHLRQAIRDLARRADETPELVLELTDFDLALSAAPVTGEGSERPSAVVVAIHDVSPIKALDRMKTLLIANISHELRHPVTTIRTYAYLIQRTSPDNEKWPHYLDALTEETDRQVQLVEDILQMSRIYTGQLAINPLPTSLDDLIELVIGSHQAVARERGVVLEYRPTPSPRGENDEGLGLTVQVDPKQMAQALRYLVGDAIRYTPEGERVLLATEQYKDQDGLTWVRVAVSDAGEEIPPGDLPYAFERFLREEEPRSTRVSETSLRLMIVKGIVELHAGRITVDSEPGKGTTFIVWLPSMR
jgi:GAF domain-containing protein/nitrogen-specific signal transduction histidine kinase